MRKWVDLSADWVVETDRTPLSQFFTILYNFLPSPHFSTQLYKTPHKKISGRWHVSASSPEMILPVCPKGKV